MVFILSKDTEEIAERGTRFLLVWFVCFWCPCQRGFTDCVRMAPPADTWPENPVELRSWREEAVLATQDRCLFF